MSTLIAKNLAKKYKTHTIVKNVSLEIHSGEVVGLLGTNGAGKTTTFYMLVGIIISDNGKITINNEDISLLRLHERANKGISYLPQEASIFRYLTVYDNLMAVIEKKHNLINKEKHNIVENLMKEFNISHIKTQLGHSLSGGERRRVEIARALAINPKFILLDEPFAGVDPISVLDIKKIIQYLKNKGLGVLITDHNVRETLDVCERAYIVNQGCIIASGTIDEIIKNKEVKRVYLGENFKL